MFLWAEGVCSLDLRLLRLLFPLFRSSFLSEHGRYPFDIFEKLMFQQLSHSDPLLRIRRQHPLKNINQIVSEKLLTIFRNTFPQTSRLVLCWVLDMLVKQLEVLRCKWKTVFVVHLDQLLNADQRGDGLEVVLLAVREKRLIISKKSPHHHSKCPHVNRRRDM